MLFRSGAVARRIALPRHRTCLACRHLASASSASTRRPLKLAIIGAGPSGFYAASRILSALPPGAGGGEGQGVEVHMYERLPTPYGLVRYGVAPDHPEVKNCQHKFDELAADRRFRFFGNVCIGSHEETERPPPFHEYTYPHALHLPLPALFPYYNNILFTYGSSLSNPLPTTAGASSSSNPVGNVIPALAFVGWYNGHPAYAHLAPRLKGVQRATIVGHGNVAVDCARMLLKSPDELASTDIPDEVLDVLRTSDIRHVEAVGRRGPGQVAFTTKEFREMTRLQGVRFQPIDDGLMADAERFVEVEGDRARKRLLGIMKAGTPGSSAERTFELGFLKSPKAFVPGPDGNVAHVDWALNSLLAPPAAPPSPSPAPPAAPAASNTERIAAVVARPTGEAARTDTGLVIESVGYRSESIWAGQGQDWTLPFDASRGRIVNDGGRIVDASGVMIPGLYTAGWVARGPVGVIASTMQNAYALASLILSDHASAPGAASTSTPLLSSEPEAGAPPEVEDRGNASARVVSLRDWQKIDAAEQERGKKVGKPRQKFRTVEGMLDVL